MGQVYQATDTKLNRQVALVAFCSESVTTQITISIMKDTRPRP